MGKKYITTNATGSIQKKDGKWYTVIAVTINGVRKPHWRTTGLKIKNNKTRAKAILLDRINDYNRRFPLPAPAGKPNHKRVNPDMLFTDYLEHWLDVNSHNIRYCTYKSREGMLKGRIRKYFDSLGTTVYELEPTEIEEFYATMYEDGLKGSTLIHYHQFMNQAMKDAVKHDIIWRNPFDRVTRPKKNHFEGSYLSVEEIHKLLKKLEGDPLLVPVTMACYYGFRRSEVLGLRWQDIDFVNGSISVEGTVVDMHEDGSTQLTREDLLKTQKSRRTLPLIPVIRDLLLQTKARQAENRKIWRSAYSDTWTDMICVDELGCLLKPNYVTSHFSDFLKKNGFRHVRFHDLRHTCASLLVKNQVDMKHIQRWLGHANYSTTADIYAHLDDHAHSVTADAIIEALPWEGSWYSDQKHTETGVKKSAPA